MNKSCTCKALSFLEKEAKRSVVSYFILDKADPVPGAFNEVDVHCVGLLLH